MVVKTLQLLIAGLTFLLFLAYILVVLLLLSGYWGVTGDRP